LYSSSSSSLEAAAKGELMSFKAVVIEWNLTFSLVVFVDVMANSPLWDWCVKVLHKCRIRMALEVLVKNRKDVGLVGPLWVDLTILSMIRRNSSDDGRVTCVPYAVHSWMTVGLIFHFDSRGYLIWILRG
jgi:hypothetical protein